MQTLSNFQRAVTPGDWCRVCGYGDKAHLLVQGYNGLLVHCRKGTEHPIHGFIQWEIEKEGIMEPGNAVRCKICAREAARRERIMRQQNTQPNRSKDNADAK